MRVDLDEARPPIWRRLELRRDVTLDVLHEVLQTVMGWTDSHLHRFQPGPGERRWGGPYFVTDWDVEEGEEGTHELDARLDQVVHTTATGC